MQNVELARESRLLIILILKAVFYHSINMLTAFFCSEQMDKMVSAVVVHSFITVLAIRVFYHCSNMTCLSVTRSLSLGLELLRFNPRAAILRGVLLAHALPCSCSN